MEIKNLSWNEHIANKNNHPLLPKTLQGLIVGKSGCGKTTLLLNILLWTSWLDYSKLSVFGKCLFQPEYKILKNGFEEQLPKEMIMRVFENRDEILREQISPNQLIEELAKRLVPKSLLSAILTNRLLMFQTQNKSPLSIKIWCYLMNSCFRNKTSVKPITFVEGIQIVIVCI